MFTQKIVTRFSLFCIILLAHGYLCGQTTTKKPIIAIIISDDHVYQSIGAYGSPYKLAPRIVKLANEGVVFSNACAANSICGPSLAILLAGKFSHKNGFKDKQTRFDALQDLFVKQLQKNSYQTVWIGKWYLESKPGDFDFWEIVPAQKYYYNPCFFAVDGGGKQINGYVTNIITDLSQNWLANRDIIKTF